MGLLLVTVRIVLAAVFLTAAVGKALDLPGTRQALLDFGAPQSIVSPGAIFLPAGESVIALALLLPQTERIGAVGAVAVLVVFVVAIARTLRDGSAPECHCFGQFHSAPAGPVTLGRNAALALLAALVAAAGPDQSITAAFEHRSGTVLALVVTSVTTAVLAATAVSLWLENRSLRAGTDTGGTRRGLPVGEIAPPFSLQATDGRTVSLQELLEPGLPLVLVLVHPGCEPCHQLLPHLGRWAPGISQSLTIAAVSAGEYVGDTGELTVLTARGFEVADAYGLRVTPSAVQIRPDGRIASVPSLGALAIEELVRSVLSESAAPTLVG